MMEKTSHYYHEKQIDFTVMGLDKISSEFLNWTLTQRDNLEFMKECKTLERVSTQSVLHHDHMRKIKRIDDSLIHERQ